MAASPAVAASRPLDNNAPYPFLPEFEQVVVLHTCTTRKFYSLIGPHLKPDCFIHDAAKLLIKAAQSVAKDIGQGPDTLVVVLQRIRVWHGDGRVTYDQINDVIAYLDEAELQKLPSHESVLSDVSKEIKKRMEWDALQQGLTAYSHHGDVTSITTQLEKAKTVGIADTNYGMNVGSETLNSLEELKAAKRFKFGIMEFDVELGGGPMAGTLTVFVGNTGGGKSMALTTVACVGAYTGYLVCVATLELPDNMWNARVVANLTEVPVNDLLAQPSMAARRLKEVEDQPGFGKIVTKMFTPKATSVNNILDWVKQCELETGRKCMVLIVDYADKISSKGATSDYQEAGNVYDAFFAWARDNSRWCFTASASKRKDKGRNKSALIDSDDLADSQNKARSSDLVITINPEAGGIKFLVAKNRYGPSGQTIGPLPTDFTIARIAPVSYSIGMI